MEYISDNKSKKSSAQLQDKNEGSQCEYFENNFCDANKSNCGTKDLNTERIKNENNGYTRIEIKPYVSINEEPVVYGLVNKPDGQTENLYRKDKDNTINRDSFANDMKQESGQTFDNVENIFVLPDIVNESDCPTESLFIGANKQKNSDSQRAENNEDIHKYGLKNPAVIFDMCDIAENKKLACKWSGNICSIHSYPPIKKHNYKCQNCGKIYTQKSRLLSHLFVHSSEKVHSCAICGKYFKTKSILTAHLQIHKTERRYKCKLCGKAFKQTGSLYTHSLIHSTESKYTCSMCQKIFSQKGNLKLHLLYHSNERQYKCITCEKSFFRNADLSRHTIVHTTNKAIYKCDICCQNLKHKKYLRRHIQRHMTKKERKNTSASKKERKYADVQTLETITSVFTEEKKDGYDVEKIFKLEDCFENDAKSTASVNTTESDISKVYMKQVEKDPLQVHPLLEDHIKKELL